MRRNRLRLNEKCRDKALTSPLRLNEVDKEALRNERLAISLKTNCMWLLCWQFGLYFV
jgi:hypothetical protein